jgi:polysaccharide export outer membrane protein
MEAARESEVRQVAEEFSAKPQGYVIGKGDVLQIIVWDHPELTIPAGSFRDAETSGQQVGDDGYLYYPYVGMVKAAGMNIAALRDVLTAKLSAYIQDPQLDVRVIGFRSKRVYVVGEVNSPGVLPLNDVPLTIADAISLSAGLTEEAYKSGVNVSRNGEVHEIDLKALYDYADSTQNLTLQHGDIVNVLDRSQQKVFVMGEVKTPRSVEIINGYLTLAAAIGEVGGVNQVSADPSGIYVVRGTDKDNPQIFHLNAEFATGMLLAERFKMQAQDVVFVDTAGVSKWNRVISQLLPSITIIGIADSITTN